MSDFEKKTCVKQKQHHFLLGVGRLVGKQQEIALTKKTCRVCLQDGFCDVEVSQSFVQSWEVR